MLQMSMTHRIASVVAAAAMLISCGGPPPEPEPPPIPTVPSGTYYANGNGYNMQVLCDGGGNLLRNSYASLRDVSADDDGVTGTISARPLSAWTPEDLEAPFRTEWVYNGIQWLMIGTVSQDGTTIGDFRAGIYDVPTSRIAGSKQISFTLDIEADNGVYP